MTRSEVLVEAGRLAADGKPYALATVVRVVRPASTRRGDRALVTPDGTLAGWVGGACSEPIVVREALRALADGEPRLVQIGPAGSGADAPDDVVVAESRCASEGVVEVLIEPELPGPLLAVLGEGVAGRTLVQLARIVGWRVTDQLDPDAAADAVVVATMGHGDEDALASALKSEVGYVGLVASARRAAVVLDDLRARGVAEEELARVRSPAGRDLGPSTQEEIAVAILAELVDWRHGQAGRPRRPGPGRDGAGRGGRPGLWHDGGRGRRPDGGPRRGHLVLLLGRVPGPLRDHGRVMTTDNRPEPPSVGGEREMLAGFLDFHRATLLWKLEGLDDEQLRRAMVPSGTSLLGLVKHLAYVERSWFQGVWDGQEVSFPWTTEDPDADWRIEPGETTGDVLAFYKAECDRSREIVAGASSLDEIIEHPRRQGWKLSRRWILIHMVEETARHVGHADILREQLDGAVGE